MRWLNYCLLMPALCAAYGQDSAVQTDTEIGRENAINFQGQNLAIFEPTDNTLSDSTANLSQNTENLTAAGIHPSGKGVQIISKSGEKEKIENMTFNDMKPFLLFPILPFLLPPREENLKRDIFSNPKNDTSKRDRGPTDGKPFIFFDFAFNIRRIPFNNVTENTSDSEIVNVEKLGNTDNVIPGPPKNRKRRHTKRKVEAPGFFDDSSLFPDSELDEFLPKPDLFFPDLPFHQKILKKLSRKKRDQDKPEIKNDVKSFFDAFDEAFMQTKNELEWADPILNFLRGGEQFDDKRKETENPFSQPPDIRGKPTMKLRIQRNMKRLNDEPQDVLIKAHDSPTIIVNKVVKFREFNVHDKNKNKRDRKDSKGKFLGQNEATIKETPYFPSSFKHIDPKRKKRNHFNSNPEGQTFAKIQTEEIRLLPKHNASFFSAGSKPTTEIKKRENEMISKKTTPTDETSRYENLMKVVDSLKSKIKVELTNDIVPPVQTLKRKGSAAFDNSRKVLKEDLRKNITQLLNQFLSLVKNLDGAKVGEKLEGVEREDAGVFNWTEKETLQSMLGKSSRTRREKKDGYFEDEYGDLVKERQVADLNYLFLGVTVPTVLVFTLVLLTCIYSLQVKGKICTKLFKTRQVFLVDNETASQFTGAATKKIQQI